MNGTPCYRTPNYGRRQRGGLSLLELIFASAATAALMLGLTSVLFTTNKAFDAGDTSARQRIRSAEVLGDVMNDLRHATSFSTRTAKAVTFKVPDRNGDSNPETISYSWSGTAGDPLMYSINGGAATAIANDVHNFDLSYVSQFLTAPKPPPIGGSQLLFVVVDASSLSTYETGRWTLLHNWGYEVTLISADDTQSVFDLELATTDVVFISADASDSEIGTKLTGTSIGIVSENSDLIDELGLATGSISDIQDEIKIKTDNHYITRDFAVNSINKVLDFAQSMFVLDTPTSADLHTLGETLDGAIYTPSLVTLDPGDELHGGGTLTGRRVQLPWGSAAVDDLTPEALTMVKRSVEWAAGAGLNSPSRDLLMIVSDDEELTDREIQRKAMLESWGFKTATIYAGASQTQIDDAVAEADICYIPAGVNGEDEEDGINNKLRHSAIGVVCEDYTLSNNLGLAVANGNLQNDKKKIDVIEKRHYITQFLPSGMSQIFTDKEKICKFSGSLGGSVVLANCEGLLIASLVTLETGVAMLGPDSDPAPARRVLLPWGKGGDEANAFDVSNLTADGREILKRSLEWVGGAEATIPKLLLVVKNSATLSSGEQQRADELAKFGYNITPISDDATQSEYDTEIASADVIYVCDGIDDLILASKITSAPIGIVNEEPESNSYLAIADGYDSDIDQIISIVNNSHYITAPFADGELTIYTGDDDIAYLDGNDGAGIQTLATKTTSAMSKSLVAIAAGDALVGDVPAAGRRVRVPWGDGTALSKFNADALTIMERSVAWAQGQGDDGLPDIADTNLGYEDSFASEATNLDDKTVAMQVTLAEDAMFTSITGYFYDKDQKLRYAIYSDNLGEPGNLLVQSDDYGPSGNGPQWTTIDVPPMLLEAGTYWLAFGVAHNNVKFYYEDDAGQEVRYLDHDAVNDGFLTSWGNSDASYTRKISIYGTYTATH